jgi:UDP:flavonoid glycosyltransferase YjiC (YdhE family)
MTRQHVLLVAEAVTCASCTSARLPKRQPRDGQSRRLRPAIQPLCQSFKGTEPIASIEPRQFLASLRRGSRLYSAATLEGYVREELDLLERVDPDLIVGDFRLSLSVSARLARVPYATITNAYWSPGYDPPQWPVPQLALTRLLPIPIAGALFQVARPFACRHHAQPHEVRRRFGLPSLGST